MTLYDQISSDCSKLVTLRYSTSFSLGIRTLEKKFRAPVYSIYGYVRLADEIVDTFHEHDKSDLLDRFEADTYRSIDEKISLNPILHSFQWVINEYGIEKELIDAFLNSMRMDLCHYSYTQKGFENYIYGSAEAVGLMCLRVFAEGNNGIYQELKEPARRLGSAFQKVNFLRDIRSDYYERGRIYFPGIDFTHFKPKDKKAIEDDIQQDFNAAYEGVIRLPKGVRKGVYLSYIYYLKLFEKIKNLPPESILQKRIRIPDLKKMALIIPTLFKNSFEPVELYKQ
jgi:phytoene synthase